MVSIARSNTRPVTGPSTAMTEIAAGSAIGTQQNRHSKTSEPFRDSRVVIVREACSHQHRRRSMTPLPFGAVRRTPATIRVRIEGVNNFRSRLQLQQAIDQSCASIRRRRQQLVQIGVKLREQLWVYAEQAEMSADAL